MKNCNTTQYNQYIKNEWKTYCIQLPEETSVKIMVNQIELANILCTPEKLDFLAVGFLCSTGIINSINELVSLEVDKENNIVHTTISKEDFSPPQRYTKTSGFGNGIIFSDACEDFQIESKLKISPTKIIDYIEKMKENAVMYKRSGGVHSTALCSESSILIQAEDIGRHNTFDKVIGECLIQNIAVSGKMLITTGRMSSEMIIKSARMRVPVIASLSSPTSKAVSLAEKCGITVVGYVNCGSFIVYSHPERIKG